MIFAKASQEDLEPHIGTFVGSEKRRSFQLVCKYCRDMGTISATPRTIGKTKYLKKAAEKFSKQGWALDRKTPVCPRCNKNTSRLAKRADSKNSPVDPV